MSFVPSINLRTRGAATIATTATNDAVGVESVAKVADVAGGVRQKEGMATNVIPSLSEKESLPLEDMTTEEIIAAVHEAFPDSAPLLYKHMPNWHRFCDAFPHCVRDDDEICTFYQPGEACYCSLFEKAFPGVGWWHMLKKSK